jgi:hypothetical protein
VQARAQISQARAAARVRNREVAGGTRRALRGRVRLVLGLVFVLGFGGGCAAPQIGYRDPSVSGVQVVDAKVARARGLKEAPLRVPVPPGADDRAAAAAFLHEAAGRRAVLASDLSLWLGDCQQPLAPISHDETHPEQVSHEVEDTTQVPEEHCDTVTDPVTEPDGTTSFDTHQECNTEWVTQTTSHTEWSTEDVTTTYWDLVRSPAACPPGGSAAAVEGTIYAP